MLADHGRAVVSDIVSETEVPPHLKVNPDLWGECLVGALTEEVRQPVGGASRRRAAPGPQSTIATGGYGMSPPLGPLRRHRE